MTRIVPMQTKVRHSIVKVVWLTVYLDELAMITCKTNSKRLFCKLLMLPDFSVRHDSHTSATVFHRRQSGIRFP